MAVTADGGSSARKAIWRTFWILAGLTTLEFVIAGTKGFYPDWFGITMATVRTGVLYTFIILTIAKAFFIVAEFMHLKHEVKRLVWIILIPFIFIGWLLIGLILEGGFWGGA
ncbi:MAG: cytochrome C oxidase subunit IV family protein [Bacteroidota bacterium]